MRDNKRDPDTKAWISGDKAMGQLVDSGIALIPMAIDPHGRWGPLTHNFLFHHRSRLPQSPFCRSRSNASRMYERITDPSCPCGIVPTATAVWKSTRTSQFYGNTYTAPTPRIFALQQLGLVVSKALALHLRHATTKTGLKPPSRSSHSSNSSTPVTAR